MKKSKKFSTLKLQLDSLKLYYAQLLILLDEPDNVVLLQHQNKHYENKKKFAKEAAAIREKIKDLTAQKEIVNNFFK